MVHLHVFVHQSGHTHISMHSHVHSMTLQWLFFPKLTLAPPTSHLLLGWSGWKEASMRGCKSGKVLKRAASGRWWGEIQPEKALIWIYCGRRRLLAHIDVADIKALIVRLHVNVKISAGKYSSCLHCDSTLKSHFEAASLWIHPKARMPFSDTVNNAPAGE